MYWRKCSCVQRGRTEAAQKSDFSFSGLLFLVLSLVLSPFPVGPTVRPLVGQSNQSACWPIKSIGFSCWPIIKSIGLLASQINRLVGQSKPLGLFANQNLIGFVANKSIGSLTN